jgi:hypothetical protein
LKENKSHSKDQYDAAVLQMREVIVKKVEEEGIVPIYTKSETSKDGETKDAWNNEGIRRFNELVMLVTIDRFQDQQKQENGDTPFEQELLKIWKAKLGPDDKDKKRKREPFDENGQWQGQKKASEIDCIDLDDVDDIELAKEKIRKYLAESGTKMEDKITTWAQV